MKTERDLFQEKYLAKINTYAKFNQSKYTEEYEDCKEQACWEMWQASANREGYKLVPVENISTFYQDDNEPEIFCENESDFDNLGDCTELDEIMVVNKYTNVNLKKEVFYGVWCKCEKKAPYFKDAEFKLFNSEDEARKAMIGAAP